MPNWCSNRVNIDQDSTDDGIAQLAAVHAIFSNPKPFNAIIPEPDWATTPNDKGELPTLSERTYERQDGTFATESVRAFGSKPDERWYDWRLRNWGCKWDLSVTDTENPIADSEEGEFLRLEFDTPWAPPVGICNALRNLYPNLHIRWFYDEPDSESAGYL